MNQRLLQTVQFMDAPVVLDATVTAIPGSGSSPLQVIAKTTKPILAIRILDGIGKFIGVYTGAPGQEVRRTIIGGDDPVVACAIAPGSRVSLRNEETSSVTTGKACLEFLGH